jgi:transcriptional regulator GlxA family with amidase domain
MRQLIRGRTLSFHADPAETENAFTFHEDGAIITCWGPATGMEVAFRLLERLTDRKRADFIRGIMGFEPRSD